MSKGIFETKNGKYRAQPYISGKVRNADTWDNEVDAEDSHDNALYWAEVFGYVTEPKLFYPWKFKKEAEAIPKTESTIRILRALEDEKGKPKEDEALTPTGARRIFEELRDIRDTAKQSAQEVRKLATQAQMLCDYIDTQLQRLEDSLLDPKEAQARAQRRLELELAVEADKRREAEAKELQKQQLLAKQDTEPTPPNVVNNPLEKLSEILPKQ